MRRIRALAGPLLRSYGGWPVHLLLAVLLVPRAVLLGEALFDRHLHLAPSTSSTPDRRPVPFADVARAMVGPPGGGGWP